MGWNMKYYMVMSIYGVRLLTFTKNYIEANREEIAELWDFDGMIDILLKFIDVVLKNNGGVEKKYSIIHGVYENFCNSLIYPSIKFYDFCKDLM
ncbi:MAG: hypothetical protein Q4C64_03595 [Erysipelotrichia bacterium]|nr:hypothetical protein [Erysipelotrichia bacterium]